MNSDINTNFKPDSYKNMSLDDAHQVKYEQYGSHVKRDKTIGIIEEVADVAKQTFAVLTKLGTVSTVIMASLTLTSLILAAPSLPIMIPILIGMAVTTVAVALLALTLFGIEAGCHYYLTKGSPPPFLLSSLTQIFETPLEEMIKHASAPKKVLEKLEELRPTYQLYTEKFAQELNEINTAISQANDFKDQGTSQAESTFKESVQQAKKDFTENKDANQYNNQVQFLDKTRQENLNKIQSHHADQIKRLEGQQQKVEEDFQTNKANLCGQIGKFYKENELQEIKEKYEEYLSETSNSILKKEEEDVATPLESSDSFTAKIQQENQKTLWEFQCYQRKSLNINLIVNLEKLIEGQRYDDSSNVSAGSKMAVGAFLSMFPLR